MEKFLSNNEWIVMKAIWKVCDGKGNATVGEIMEITAAHHPWHVSTVKTTLTRLVEKGFLKSHIRGKTCFYEPVAEEESVVKKGLGGFLDNILDDTFGPLVAYLADRKGLSEKEIKMLKKILEKKD